MDSRYDFGGYATKNNLKCMDGRTIRRDAFKDCDGMEVPLVWGHKHGSPGDVLGHAVLENRDDGVYTYGVFNNTEAGKNAKELVRHGDVKALSIYANQLVQKGGDVLHGVIREVSLCLAGANPGARIEELSFEHSSDEDSDDFEALLFNGHNIDTIEHADEEEESGEDSEEETVQDVFDNMTEEQKNVVYFMIGQALENENEDNEEEDEEESDEEVRHMANDNDMTVKDVFDSMTDEQKNVVYFMIGQALEQQGDDEEEDNEVAHNVFENDDMYNSLSHAAAMEELNNVIADGPNYGSLRKAYEAHMSNGSLAHAVVDGMEVPDGSVTYGINGIDYLFPDARTLNGTPEFIQRDQDWVKVLLNAVHKSPFSRIKTVVANITEPEARAKGYVKGNQKDDEFFGLMKRVTTPQTIYKRQKFDRDDILDITDMNVVAWVKTEMRTMLDEEIARAILIGDGRNITSDDKISEEHVRPIVSDNNWFTIKQAVTAGKDDEETAKNAIKAAIRARKTYKGSGNPVFFTTEDWFTNMMLVEDSIGRRLYDTEASLASAIRASKIVTVPDMENYTDGNGRELIGIMFNPVDYNVGTDKGGEINLFDDFDIDYNQYKYLIETRASGCLVKPYSAIALFKTTSSTTTT